MADWREIEGVARWALERAHVGVGEVVDLLEVAAANGVRVIPTPRHNQWFDFGCNRGNHPGMPHKRMAAFRASQAWSQAELALRLGISQGFVAQVESGRKRLGLAPALALERLTATWAEGPIAASEWVHPSNVVTPETPDEAA